MSSRSSSAPASRESEASRIICGDALDVLRHLASGSVHMVITSPPYNLGLDYDGYKDAVPYPQYLACLRRVWLETRRLLVSGGRLAVNIASHGGSKFRPTHHDVARGIIRAGFRFRTEVIWYKQNIRNRRAWGSFKSPSNPAVLSSWEYVYVFDKDRPRLEGDRQDADITSDEFVRFTNGFWAITPETRRFHPAPFPEELVYRLVKLFSYRGNVILDMFAGSGTVAAVASSTGRKHISIEQSPLYCALAESRVAQVADDQARVSLQPTSVALHAHASLDRKGTSRVRRSHPK